MLCPQCRFEGNPVNGKCARCGFNLASVMTRPQPTYSGRSTTGPMNSRRGANSGSLYAATMSQPPTYGPMPGDNLREGRYRLVKTSDVQETQRSQGNAWIAQDTKNANRQVVIREVRVPATLAYNSSADRVIYTVVQRQAELGKHPGFPQVTDLFREGDIYYVVFLYPEGESLGTLLKRLGGLLPEYMVAEIGYHICGYLALLAGQQPPMVHGAINPESILIGEDGQLIGLINTPFFPPDLVREGGEKANSPYYAPEQVHGEANPSSDLYSLAVVMHHAVTGHDPHARIAMFHPPARRLNPAVTPQMDAILARQLDLSQAQRYSDPLEMQKELAALLETYPDPADQKAVQQALNPLAMSPAQLRERTQSNTLLNMGVLSAVCVLILVGVLLAALRP